MLRKLLLLFVAIVAMSLSAVGQTTTSGISGQVKSGGETVIGATVTAKHLPSGTFYRAVTNVDGRYTIQGMRVGGPYEVEISYIGHKSQVFHDVSLLLGETQNLSCTLEEDAVELEGLVVTGKAGLNGTRTGAAQSISAQQIAEMPTVSHSVADIARLNPQIQTTNAGAMSFAGTSNKYNSFQIDGAMNNDVFGLTSNGSNGGQAGTQPVSLETLEQMHINVAPFDVRQSGFTGGAINAITKSGTNQFHGSAYFYGYNENLIGKKYKMATGNYSQAYQDESDYIMGLTFGGPIIKDKLFFFANYERSNKEYPNLYGLGSDGLQVDGEMASQILDAVKDMAAKQGVHYGGAFTNPDIYTRSDKAGLKLDWNINTNNKFSLRWSLVHAKQLNNTGGRTSLNDNSYFYPFTSNTNSFIAELQSRLSATLSNELRLSYVRVRDERKQRELFPSIVIQNVGQGTVNIGNNRSSMANQLDQDIWTLEDNLTWYKRNHTITFGTHNELYTFANLFIEDLFGSYTFSSGDNFLQYYDSFLSGQPDGSLIYRYQYQHANVDVTGDPHWKAKFSAGQLGFYAQDKWDAAPNVQITYGLRMDIPLFFDTPSANVGFNEYARTRGWGVKTNTRPKSTPLWSPRVGFRWDINNDRRYILRGGVGVFTGRIPFVWVSNNFSNTGVQLSSYNTYNCRNLELLLDRDNQTPNEEKLTASGSQVVNVYDKHFKFAQTMRMNLGFDFQLLGINWTAEAIYSKTLNDIYYKNLAIEETGMTYGQMYNQPWDNRPMFQRSTVGQPYSEIYGLYNTSKGYTVNLSLKAEKHFNFGLDLMASYTWTRSMTVNNGSSSVARSNWIYNYTHRNPNKPELGNSAYNVPHRIMASAYYHINYGANDAWQTTIGVIYEGRSGSPYSMYYYGDMNGDGASGNDLFFIPTDAQLDQMRFDPVKNRAGEVTMSEADQREAMRAWIKADSYMRDHRGQYYKRYADNLRFEHHFDVHIAQKFSFKVGKQINSLELSMNILNVGNLLNKDWGRTYGNSFGVYYSPVNYQGNGLYQYTGNYSTRNYSDFYSRWRGQIGLKYTF
ncbi:MAG: TonB-dependent receptor [Bacteroidaceae bacterium]|nr:TonB-dependent receptor [Bacteroidaceae bacterium]